MTDYAESTDTPYPWQGRFQSNVELLAMNSLAEVEESEFLPELSKEQASNLISTTESSSFDMRHYLQSFIDASKSKLTQRWHLFLFLNTESLSTDEHWFKPHLTETVPGFRQTPETHWIRDFAHTSYHLRQPIPILVNYGADIVTTKYYLELDGSGGNLEEAISDLCGKMIVHYEAVQNYTDRTGSPSAQQPSFLKQTIVETQAQAWDEIKRLYRERLKAFPYVDRGYINISTPDYAEVVIILSDESADRIKQLAQIDLEINLRFRPLNFSVEYESSEEFLDLKNFKRFYQSTPKLAP